MITVKWDNPEKNIIRYDYHSPILTWAEYEEANDQAIAMIRSVSHPVYVIHNPGQAEMPKGSPIPHLRKAMLQYQQVPNCAMVIAVIENLFALNMVSVVAKVLFPKKFRLAGSLAAAYTLALSNEPIASTPLLPIK